MTLRPYQKKALYAIKKSYMSGDRKQVIVLATGLGKTVIFAHLINDITKYYKKKALVLIHREELLHQAKDKLLKINPDLDIGLEMAEKTADGDHDVVVASVATIGRSGSKRIKKFNPKDFVIIVTDEAHHASASSYKNVYRHFGVLKEEPGADANKDLLMLGVTATPSRNDNQGIDTIYDKVTYEYGIIKGIENGHLVPIRAYRVDTAVDLSKVKRIAGDFNQGELGDAVNNEERNKLVVKTYLERVPGQQALCFAVNVAHTMELCQEFKRAGLAAEFITGETLKEDRHQILKDFSSKKVKVLINCAVLTEGFDEPNIQTILMARPTQSGILFQQMIGRGTRLADGKEYLTIIDFVDNTYKQTLQTTASLLGIPAKLDFKGKDILDVKTEIDKLIDLAPYIDLDNLDIDNIKYAIEEVDLLSGLKIPEEIDDATILDWQKYMQGHYILSLPEKRVIHIRETVTADYTISDAKVDETTGKKTEVILMTMPTLKSALLLADAHVKENYSDAMVLLSTKSPWRKREATDVQIDTLRRMGVNETVLQQLNRGTASRLFGKLKNYTSRQRRSKFVGQIN